MGNKQLTTKLLDQSTNLVEIADWDVTFFNGQFKAESIFQRHNFQIYKVRQTVNKKLFYLRSINALTD